MVGSAVTPSSLSPPATGDLVLRLSGSRRNGQVVRLKSSKCTIGSAAGCTLRLRARGVGPLHCLILRGRRRTVVRRWSADTRLNGQTFNDAELRSGDRLGIGAIELEVLQPGQPSEARAAESPPPRPEQTRLPDPELDLRKPDLSMERRLDELNARLELANRQGRQRLRKLIQQFRQARQEIARLTAAQRQLEQSGGQLDAQRDALQQQQRQLDTQRAELQDQLSRRTGELDARQTELDVRIEGLQRQLKEKAEQLDSRQAQLEAQEKDLREQQLRWEDQRSEIQSLSAEESQKFETRLSELDAQRDALQQQQRQFETERAEAQQQLAERQQQLQADEAALQRRREAVEAELKDIEQRRQQAETECARGESEQIAPPADSRQSASPESRDDSPRSPVELKDVLSRMGSLDLLGDQGTEEEPRAEPQPEPLQTPMADQPEVADRPLEGTEEESIDEYMTRLMQRVGHAGGQTDPHKPFSPPLTEDEPDASPGCETTPAVSAESEEISRRAMAPEKQVDLSAMRELANLQAEAAISRHSRRKMVSITRTKLLITITALAIGGILIWMWWAMPVGNLAFYAALVSFLIAVFWGVQYAVLIGYLIVNKSGRLERKPRESGSGEDGTREGNQQSEQ